VDWQLVYTWSTWVGGDYIPGVRGLAAVLYLECWVEAGSYLDGTGWTHIQIWGNVKAAGSFLVYVLAAGFSLENVGWQHVSTWSMRAGSRFYLE
jgi:hypothetical protein